MIHFVISTHIISTIVYYVNCRDIDKKKTGSMTYVSSSVLCVRSSVTGLEYLSELKWNESYFELRIKICVHDRRISDILIIRI